MLSPCPGLHFQAPHEWKSKDQLLVNNYFPVKKNWEERKRKEKSANEGKSKIPDIKWPSKKVLYADRSELMDMEWDELLEDEWVKDFLTTLKRNRPGFADFCIAVVCDKERVKAGSRDHILQHVQGVLLSGSCVGQICRNCGNVGFEPRTSFPTGDMSTCFLGKLHIFGTALY